MERRHKLISGVKKIRKSPLASNVGFGFILVGLEKLVELQFQCPCRSTWNIVFASLFFIVPAVMAFTVMLIIQGYRCSKRCCKGVSLSSFVPAIMWLILLFLDGQYFACAMTDWEGRFVPVDKETPQKWCEPINAGNVTLQELKRRSRQFFVESQVIGIGLLLVIWLCFFLCVSCQKKVEGQDATSEDSTAQSRISSQTAASREASLLLSSDAQGKKCYGATTPTPIPQTSDNTTPKS